MRHTLIALSILLFTATTSPAQVSVGISLPNVSIGINLPVYPRLVRVPNYPVYYAPGIDSNYFFYDGYYWVYQDDQWYASAWYNGPWGLVEPAYVPLFVLRIPVRYYRAPPRYFRGWRPDAAPRWHEHWGDDWARQREGWDRWNRRTAPAPAPLPAYQKRYSGDRYPQADQQRELRERQYHYQPREVVRPAEPPAQRPQERTDKAPHGVKPVQRDAEDHVRPRPAPAAQERQHGQPQVPERQPPPTQPRVQAPTRPQPAPHEQPAHRAHPPEAPHAQAPAPEPKRAPGPGKHDREEGGDRRGPDHNR
jgi:hypothetical protein